MALQRDGENVMVLIGDDVADLARRVADRPNEKPRMPRYSAEWLDLIALGQSKGWKWASLLPTSAAA